MAKARDSAPDPPVESEEESGEEEESSSEEEIEGSESESEPEPPRTQNSQVTKKPIPAPTSKKPEPQPSKTQPADSSSDDGESESETDSDAKPDPSIKPIASKPMDDAQKTPTTKRPRSKPTPGPTSPVKPSPVAAAKRPSAAAGAADGEAKETKRLKKNSESVVEGLEKKGNPNDDSKKLFQRLWSEDDEIAILEGMIDYQAKKKADPVADLNDFLAYIKKSLHIDVSKTQLQAKIRRLKKKYENNASKERKGKKKVFSKAHEEIAYQLSKKIWGKENNGGDHTVESHKVNGKAVTKSRTKNAFAPASKVDEREEAVMEDKNLDGEKTLEGLKSLHSGFGSSGIEGWIAKNSMEVIKGEKREEMEEKWKKLNVEEIEIYAKKLELMLEQTKFILEAIKSSGH